MSNFRTSVTRQMGLYGQTLDSVKWTVTINRDANGYRLPTETEWLYAASGGHKFKDYMYSGSNEIDDVGWYWRNSGDSVLTGPWFWTDIEKINSSTKPVSLKNPNSKGLYDMSGNIREWCREWYKDFEIGTGFYRIWRGGGWIGGEHACRPSYRGKLEANGKGPDQGFRICRSNYRDAKIFYSYKRIIPVVYRLLFKQYFQYIY